MWNEDFGRGNVGAKCRMVADGLIFIGDEVAVGMMPTTSVAGLVVTGFGMGETVGCVEGANTGTTVGGILLMGDEEITAEPVFPMHLVFPTQIMIAVVPLVELLVEVPIIVIFVAL
jgi:hypothetical protein